MAKQIDVQKLRGFLLERKQRHQAVNTATDAYLDLRQEVGRLEGDIEQKRKRVGGPSPNDERRLEDLKEQMRELERQRDAASRELEEWAFVEDLVDYARSLGYSVDTVTGTVTRPPVRDKRNVGAPHAPPSNYPSITVPLSSQGGE